MPNVTRSTRWLTAPLLSLAMLGAMGAASADAQQPAAAPALDRIMSADERASAGLERLSAAERAALDAWLARYTETVVAVTRAVAREQAAGDSGQALSPAAVRSELPGQYLVPATASPATSQVTVLRGAVTPLVTRVTGVFDDGALVQLADGSTWEILVDDRARTAGWRAGESIRVRRLAAPTNRRYDLQLENVSGGWRAAARPLSTP